MEPTNDNNIVVAVGASAGGLQSLTAFFDNIPENSPYTFVIIQHLSPDYTSYTDELLSRKTKIPISKAEQDFEMEKNHIYVIPSDKNLILTDGKMKLLDKPTGKKLNLPIDLFLESLAKSHKQNAVAIIMSGTGSDGTKGIKFIKEQGGLVVVQQPDQAKFSGMPQSAINSNLADFVLPVEEMYQEIQMYYNSPDLIDTSSNMIHIDEKALKRILDLIEVQTDLDFNQYKKPTLLRRMGRRMKILQLSTIQEYLAYLEDNDREVDQLYKDFLIGVTKFFRDTDAWEVLKKHVVPELVKYKKQGGEIKVWDVGCNTGEEAYSLAMLFLEECKKQDKDINLKIFATDISQQHLDLASKGVYSTNAIADLDANYITTYFVKRDDGHYKVIDKLRRQVLFTNHNILKDPPFNNIDFCLCRNLLIYLQSPVQLRVLKVLHYSLKLDSFLMLGSSENLGSEEKYYEEISRKWKIYRNVKTTKRSRNKSLTASETFNFSDQRGKPKSSEPLNERIRRRRRSEENISSAILRQFNATTIMVDEDFSMLEAKGHLGRFAEFPEDGYSNSLLEILPTQLILPIKTAVKKARKSDNQIIYEKIFFEKDDRKRLVDIMVLPMLFDEMGKTENFAITLLDRDDKEVDGTIVENATLSATASTRIADLEEELQQTRHELNKAIEETETSNEELQASNEELLASNEELQSTNEELQSVNEELHTVNNEHIQKMEELSNLNADMDNLLESTEIGVIYLDSHLRIRKFTPAVKVHFNLMAQDIGRHIDNFIINVRNRSDNDLIAMAKKVLESGKTLDQRVKSKDKKNFLMRMTPFYTVGRNIDGVVIALTDIEQIHNSQQKLLESERKFKDFYDSDPIMHVSINPNTGMIVECNNRFIKRMGYETKKEIIGKTILDFYADESKLKASKLLEQIRKDGEINNVELIMQTQQGQEIPVVLSSNLKKGADGTLFTRSSLIDITKLKEVQNELKNQKRELEQINKELEQFVSICSHDLQEPLSTIRFSSELLKRKFSTELSDKAQEYADYIYEASGRLSNQITALLDHSRLGQNVEKSVVDIAELVEIVKYDLSEKIRETNTKITTGKLPKINGYNTELRLLFQNLIGNSIKYARDGVPPDIRINAIQDDKAYIFSISDNGMGIPEDELDNVFTIFRRASSGLERNGAGVGLAHCEKIIKLHNGKIWVDSQLGVGSTFYFKLNA